MSCLERGSGEGTEGSQTEVEMDLKESLTYKQRRTKGRNTKRKKQREFNQYKNDDRKESSEPRSDTGKQQYSNEDTTWGDELIISDEWKEQNSQQSLRLVQYNANGITAMDDYMEYLFKMDMLI